MLEGFNRHARRKAAWMVKHYYILQRKENIFNMKKANRKAHLKAINSKCKYVRTQE